MDNDVRENVRLFNFCTRWLQLMALGLCLFGIVIAFFGTSLFPPNSGYHFYFGIYFKVIINTAYFLAVFIPMLLVRNS